MDEDLQTASERLSEQVATLSLALQTVGTVQAKQVEIDAKLDKSLRATAEQRVISDRIQDRLHGVVNQKDMEIARRVLATRLTTIGVAVIALITVVILGTANYLQGRNADLYRACLVRNQTSQALARFAQERQAEPGVSPTARHSFEELGKALALVDCESLR